MKWKKLGNIFNLEKKNSKMWSHTANPTILFLDKDTLRIFYSMRDKEGKSNLSYFDYSMKDLECIKCSTNISLEYGKIGEIDESGIGAGNIINIEGKEYIYYMAWQNENKAHWRGDIARAKLDKKREYFEKDRTFKFSIAKDIDKVSLSYPFLLKKENKYYMWYGSTITWDYGNGEMLHIINVAESDDGKEFYNRKQALKYKIGEYQAFSRPSVIYYKDKWRMWFSYRGNGDLYKIGYAESDDMDNWEIIESGINISNKGWDSEMVCYPYVFEYKDKLYMLYNGNGYGKTGIGLAILEEE